MHKILNTRRIATAPTATPTTTLVEIPDVCEGGGDDEEGGGGLLCEVEGDLGGGGELPDAGLG